MKFTVRAVRGAVSWTRQHFVRRCTNASLLTALPRITDDADVLFHEHRECKCRCGSEPRSGAT